MFITFVDAIGLCVAQVDDDGIAFCDGRAYFSDGENEHIVKIEDIREITEG